ncbi:MAG: hypothetical protein ACON33_01900 [Candidatus Micropelagos thuwalensis]
MENFDVELSDNKSKMTLLSPEIIEIRNKIVDKLEGKSLKDIRSNIKDFLDNEKKEETRLAALAARIVLLRRFISELTESQELLEKEEMDKFENEIFDNDDNFEDDNESDDFEGDINWKRLRIIEDCEVNGVRFPAGIQIDVKLIDAERLLEAGQAEMVEKPVNPVEAETEEAETEDEAETEEETADDTSKTLEEDTDDTEAEVVEGEDDAEPTEEEDDTSDSDAAASGDEESD